MTTLEITLENLEDTNRLARWMARNISGCPGVRALLLRGKPGSGKTTFTAALVRALPGGDLAEVASPSFTLCNHYPTTPPVLHGDLYRCASAVPDEIAEALQHAGTLTILEWAEYLPWEDFPEDFLDILFTSDDNVYLLTMNAVGPDAQKMTHALYLWTEKGRSETQPKQRDSAPYCRLRSRLLISLTTCQQVIEL
ncbi:MAG: tRNA (adenosine(37)-N6)-threonylcarbamoyltransferase complex ATPase subunit type 1 TsaE [Desulfovibrio sp.]|jgi:tRNA threonylcarbamoyladenosine biosynthesis protein TsaE|nr:tRNA (adenosine(37)-N6)-threonylcarbamoyltransferase complex ATPase subunit type 1 TsaE [Desulfovibrio sp.]